MLFEFDFDPKLCILSPARSNTSLLSEIVSFLGSHSCFSSLHCTPGYLSPSFRPRPRMLLGLGSYLQIRAAATSWRRWCCTLSRPRHRERVRAAHSSSSSSRAGGTFGQLWLVVHWTCRQPLGRNTAPRRQQREYCQYYPPLFQNISSNQLLCATVARK